MNMKELLVGIVVFLVVCLTLGAIVMIQPNSIAIIVASQGDAKVIGLVLFLASSSGCAYFSHELWKEFITSKK